MSEPLSQLGLMVLCLAGLYVYGIRLLHRMGQEVERRGGRARPPLNSPLSAPWLVPAYRALSERDHELPRLHRSLRLCQVLMGFVVLAAAGVVVRTIL